MRLLGALLLGVWQRVERQHWRCWLLADQARERPAWANFEQDVIGVLKNRRQAIGKPDGVAEVADPITRVGRVLSRHPGTRQVRDIRHSGRLQLHTLTALAKGAESGLHHGGVKRM